MRRLLTALAIAFVLSGCSQQESDDYSYAEFMSGAVGNRAGVVMIGGRIGGTVDGLKTAQGWLNGLVKLLGGGKRRILDDRVHTVRELKDGRYAIYTLARAPHWWTADSARHEDTRCLAGNISNWDFQTWETYPTRWTHDWMISHQNDGTQGPSNFGVRRLYQRYAMWEAWSE